MKTVREKLVEMYRKMDPNLTERAANDRVTDFGIITGRANERQLRFLNLACDAENLAFAQQVGRYLHQIMPTRIYSRDLAVLMSLIVTILLKVEDDKQDDFLADYAEATKMMLSLARLETDDPVDPGVAERGAKAESDMSEILKWFPQVSDE